MTARPFTAEDVVFSLNRAMSSTSDFKGGDFATITAVEAVDDHTVRIKTAGPNMILPDELNIIPMMSKRWAEEHDALLPAAYGDDVTSYAENHANGTGPFKLVSFAAGVGTVMTRNPEWWGLAQNPHNLDRIVHTVIKDPAPASPGAPQRRDRLPQRSAVCGPGPDRGYAGLEARARQ